MKAYQDLDRFRNPFITVVVSIYPRSPLNDQAQMKSTSGFIWSWFLTSEVWGTETLQWKRA